MSPTPKKPRDKTPARHADESIARKPASDKAAHEAHDSAESSESAETPTMTVCGYEFPLRRNGTFPPPIVRKLILATEERSITERKFVRDFRAHDVELGDNKLYAWKKVSGEPSVEQITLASELYDISLKYLTDDRIPETSPTPRRVDFKSFEMDKVMHVMGLSIEDVEDGLKVLYTMKTHGIKADQAVKIIAAASQERANLMGGARIDHDWPESRQHKNGRPNGGSSKGG